MTDYTNRPPDTWTPPTGEPVAVEEFATPGGPTAVRFIRRGDKTTASGVKLLARRSEMSDEKRNCWTCGYNVEDAPDSHCALENGAVEGLFDWLDDAGLDDFGMPPRDADGCPGWEAKDRLAQEPAEGWTHGDPPEPGAGLIEVEDDEGRFRARWEPAEGWVDDKGFGPSSWGSEIRWRWVTRPDDTSDNPDRLPTGRHEGDSIVLSDGATETVYDWSLLGDKPHWKQRAAGPGLILHAGSEVPKRWGVTWRWAGEAPAPPRFNAREAAELARFFTRVRDAVGLEGDDCDAVAQEVESALIRSVHGGRVLEAERLQAEAIAECKRLQSEREQLRAEVSREECEGAALEADRNHWRSKARQMAKAAREWRAGAEQTARLLTTLEDSHAALCRERKLVAEYVAAEAGAMRSAQAGHAALLAAAVAWDQRRKGEAVVGEEEK